MSIVEATPATATELTAEARRRLARLSEPLGVTIAGMLVVVFDPHLTLVLGSRSSSVDVLPDALGYALLAAGLGLLGSGGRLEGKAELVAFGVASLFAGLTAFQVASWFVPALGSLDPRGLLVLDVAAAAGLVAICWVLHQLCRDLGLETEARTWLVAALLCAVNWPLPVALPLLVPPVRSSPGLTALADQSLWIPVAALFVAALQLRSAARSAPPRSARRGVTR